MDESRFWARIDGLGRGSTDRRAERLRRELGASDPAEILGFADQLAIHLRRLDTPEHAEVADDAFLYMRCAVVVAGRAAYTKVADSPRHMSRYRDREAELLLTVAPEAYERVTGLAWDHETPVSFESGTGPLWGNPEVPAWPDTGWLAFSCGYTPVTRTSREYEVTGALLDPALNADPAWQDWWRTTGIGQLEAHLIFDETQPESAEVRRGRRLVRATVVRSMPGFASTHRVSEPERARADLAAVLGIVAAELGLLPLPTVPPVPDLPPDI